MSEARFPTLEPSWPTRFHRVFRQASLLLLKSALRSVWRDRWFWAVAFGIHAAILISALVTPPPPSEPAPPPLEVQVQVDVEESRPPTITEMPAAVARVETPRNTEITPQRSEQRPAVGRIDPGPVPSVVPSVEPSPTTVVVPGPAPTGTSEYSTPAPMVQTGPINPLTGLGAGPAWSIPGAVPDMGRPAPAPTVAPKATVDPKIATKVLTDAVKEKDKALGLDLPAGGTIASSVRSAVQQVDTPPESRATFEIKLSPTGQVLSVRVTSSSGGTADAWARASAAATGMLKGKTMMMGSAYEKGAVVYVNVTSALTLPDGSKSAITQKGAGATFDVANIGAHMQRVVKTSFSVVAVK
jgi:hypothetical protein